MRWINKRNRRRRKIAHRVTRRFLQFHWDNEVSSYINCDYDEFRREGKMTTILYREQKGLCCYCMRKLTLYGQDKNVTIEHVMPQNVKEKDTPSYYREIGIFKKHVAVTTDRKFKQWKHQPYPHFCAYENLTLSCDGSIYSKDNPQKEYIRRKSLHQTCNNIRGDVFITPLFYKRSIERIISYNADGQILCPEEYDDTIHILGLDHSTLSLIRRGWARIANRHSVEDVEFAKNDENLRNTIVDHMEFDTKTSMKLTNQFYWILFAQYSWFYNYYKHDHTS